MTTCSCGCGNPAKARGLAEPCYQAWRRTQKGQAEIRARASQRALATCTGCGALGCRAKGLCQRCYNRQQKREVRARHRESVRTT